MQFENIQWTENRNLSYVLHGQIIFQKINNLQQKHLQDEMDLILF